MTKYIIYNVLLVFFLFLLFTGYGSCEQNNQSILLSVRTGEHENFTRIVFEFQNAVKFKEAKIEDKGIFSVVFLNSSTDLPPLTVYWTDSFQKVQSVKLNKKNSNLTAKVKLTFPNFLLKTFSLSNPDRVVMDAYNLPDLSKDSGENTSSNDGTSSKVFKNREIKEEKKFKSDSAQDRIMPGR